MELFALLVLSVGGVSAALFARFYYGMTVTSAYYYLIQKTPLGQMIHDTKCSKHAEHVHAQSSLHDCGTFIVRTVAFLEDSYCHLIVDKDTGRMAAVDPGDAKRVLSHVGALQAAWDAVHRSSREAADSKVELVDDEDVDSAGSKSDVTIPAGPPPPAAAAALLSAVRSRPELSTVLITHNHPEAAGGNRALREALPDVRIVAPAREAVVGATAVATHGAKLFLGRTEIDALATPAHTAGGMCYYLHGPAAAAPGRGRRHTAAAGAVSAEAGSGDGSADAATPTASAFAASASVATSEDDGQEWASGMAVGRTFAAANGALFTGDTRELLQDAQSGSGRARVFVCPVLHALICLLTLTVILHITPVPAPLRFTSPRLASPPFASPRLASPRSAGRLCRCLPRVLGGGGARSLLRRPEGRATRHSRLPRARGRRRRPAAVPLAGDPPRQREGQCRRGRVAAVGAAGARLRAAGTAHQSRRGARPQPVPAAGRAGAASSHLGRSAGGRGAGDARAARTGGAASPARRQGARGLLFRLTRILHWCRCGCCIVFQLLCVCLGCLQQQGHVHGDCWLQLQL